MTVNDGAASRVAFVSGARLPGWVQRFAASHGQLSAEELDGGLELRAADGAFALLQPPWPVDGRPGAARTPWRGSRPWPDSPGASARCWSAAEGIPWRSSAAAQCSRPRPAPAMSSRARLRAAGPSSASPGAAPTRPMPWWRPSRSTPGRIFKDQPIEYLAPGGDRTLADLVLAEPGLKPYAALARLPFLDVPDPRAAVLKKAAADLCAVRILVTDPAP